MGFSTRDWRYGSVALVVGGGVMTVEMTASRLMAPYFGASFFVWTSLIVTVLVAMAAGYWLGGRLSRHHANDKYLGYLLLAGAGTMAGGLLLLPHLAVSMRTMIAGVGLGSATLFLGSLAVCAVVFAAPVFLLAAASPLIIKLWGHHDDLGVAAGRYFAISTVGSVVGTLAPALVLVPLIGSRLTFMGTAALFFVTALMLLPRPGRPKFLLWAVLVAASLAVATPPVAAGTLLLAETPYETLRVSEDQHGWRYLSFNEGMGVQTVMPPDHGATGMYFDFPEIAPRLHAGSWDDYRVATVGVAGGSSFWAINRAVPAGAHWSAVGIELNPAVAAAGRRFFDLDQLPLTTVIADGRIFLETTSDQYDLLFIDAYSQQLYIPSHLVTREFFATTRQRLRAGGLLMMNVNAADRHSPILRTMLNTVAAAYPWVALVRVENSWNWIILAAESPKDLLKLSMDESLSLPLREAVSQAETVTGEPGGRVFTDDWAPVDLMTDAMFLEAAVKHQP
jgi:spermidine synthase